MDNSVLKVLCKILLKTCSLMGKRCNGQSRGFKGHKYLDFAEQQHQDNKTVWEKCGYLWILKCPDIKKLA